MFLSNAAFPHDFRQKTLEYIEEPDFEKAAHIKGWLCRNLKTKTNLKEARTVLSELSQQIKEEEKQEDSKQVQLLCNLSQIFSEVVLQKASIVQNEDDKLTYPDLLCELADKSDKLALAKKLRNLVFKQESKNITPFLKDIFDKPHFSSEQAQVSSYQKLEEKLFNRESLDDLEYTLIHSPFHRLSMIYQWLESSSNNPRLATVIMHLKDALEN